MHTSHHRFTVQSDPPSKPPAAINCKQSLGSLGVRKINISFFAVIFIFASQLSFTANKSLGGIFFPSLTKNVANQSQILTPKLADGCYHVYLDVGSNIGVHNRFLFEPEKYPNARVAHTIFNNHFGKNRNNHDLCAFGFEPNPAHKDRHKALQESYHKMGWRYHFINAGVSDNNGNMTFYHNNDVRKKEFGFSSVRQVRGSTPEVVPVLRLAEWINREVKGRLIPQNTQGNRTLMIPPKVIMKVDIEGMEQRVLPDLYFSGVACSTLDYIFGELHNYNFDAHNGRGSISLRATDRESIIFQQTLLKAFNSVRNCKTSRFDELDDEVYLHDGIPFPV